MKTKIQIKNILGSVLFEYESEENTIKETLTKAVENKKDLQGAYLQGADLRGADLQGADLQGAYLRGEKLTKEPMQIIGLKYFILITIEQIKIGCEHHKIEEWKKYDDKTILKMDGKEGLKWWKENRKFIFECHKKHCED